MSKMVATGVAAFAAVAAGQDLAGHYVSDMELEHFRLVNELRAEGFTCPKGNVYAPNPEAMQFDCRLWRAARLHSVDMVENNYLSHYSKDGTAFTDRALAQGIQAAGENILSGYKEDAASAVSAWASSDGHCNGMMNPDRVLFGVGAWEYPTNNWSKWTQLYAGSNWVATLDQSCIPGPGQTPSPTPNPTPVPTEKPFPTPKPTPEPSFATPEPTASELTVICNPLADCIADPECYEKYMPLCATYGTHNCGMPASITNDPESEFCVLETVSMDSLISVCGPHPDDAAASWSKCYGTAYWKEEQCTAGGESQGVTCQWVQTGYDGFASFMQYLFG